MICTAQLLAIALVAFVGLGVGPACAATVTSFGDIVSWVGTGSQRAAFVIDFDGDAATDQSLVWGYRWDGAATGRTMLDAIVAADARLFARVGDQRPWLGGILGLGYDRNNDGHFTISEGGPFDADGFAHGAPNENVTPSAGDWYREGWDEEFWHYGLSDGNPWTTGSWTYSRVGAHDRPLADGDWDSWAFTLDADNPAYYRTIFAQNPVIAIPPAGHADFDADGDVDGNDFVIWQRGIGLADATPMQGDADGDGLVSASDLSLWRVHYGLTATAVAVATPVPEPVFPTTCASAMFVLFRSVRQRRRSAS